MRAEPEAAPRDVTTGTIPARDRSQCPTGFFRKPVPDRNVAVAT
eukprot:CAMPEP_0196665014 /NCGR_PEP_ID=MMETSP1086-20130531/59331_1 /TAXON_ID=77921 /ORGANISM="Cyanoptyche  gloeocystis , Strain SAG4.97" /LENGTH=43 /DNA_ID= /DNA_START= /DNA_END= /DNA_ORIENTATION=